MKIAIISDVLGEQNNGTSITTKRLIDSMKERGHEVFVVSPLTSNEEGYYSLKKRNFYMFNKYVEKNGVTLAVPNKKLLREIIELVDVVHILLPFKTGKAAIKIAMELNKPFTTAFHAPAETITSHLGLKNFKPANNFIYRRFYNKFYHHAQFIHCPSEFMANEIRTRGYNMDLRAITNGVTPLFRKLDVEKPKHLKDKFVVLFVGRLSKEKRHDLVVDAVLNSKYKDNIQLIFAGHGPLKEKLEKQAKNLPNKLMVEFKPKEELVKLINYSDLYVHASDIESEAIACIEAISCGKTAVISDSPRSATKAFALTDKNLFKAGDYLDLAKKIDYFIENPDVLTEQNALYEKYAESFRIESAMDEMEKMFFDAIKFYKK